MFLIKVLHELVKHTPNIYVFFFLICALKNHNLETVLTFFAVMSNTYVNGILKGICIPIFKDGCSRPAKYKMPKNPTVYNSGFPSGHSQMSAFVSTILIKKLMKTPTNKNKFLIFCLVIHTLLVMYSRLETNHHTVTQVICGALIGVIYGHYFDKFISEQKNLK